jgi:two-component system, cell cycle response regulator
MHHEGHSALPGMPILIVEDDIPSSKLLSVVLRTEGCDTRSVSTAEDALDTLKWFKPRAIVLDLVLPQMSGLLLAQRLKADPSTREIVIIAVSAFNGSDAVRVALAVGCAAYVRKPIDAIAFPHLLLSHLGVTP